MLSFLLVFLALFVTLTTVCAETRSVTKYISRSISVYCTTDGQTYVKSVPVAGGTTRFNVSFNTSGVPTSASYMNCSGVNTRFSNNAMMADPVCGISAVCKGRSNNEKNNFSDLDMFLRVNLVYGAGDRCFFQ